VLAAVAAAALAAVLPGAAVWRHTAHVLAAVTAMLAAVTAMLAAVRHMAAVQRHSASVLAAVRDKTSSVLAAVWCMAAVQVET
jgi:demethoxyubiquinone hydroxylase (CLK1/Coq7/Cat5 family)